MIKVAVLGGSGYTALELVRILLRHPHAEIVAVVHHLGDVRGDEEVGVARAPGHDGDDVLVEPRAIVLTQILH